MAQIRNKSWVGEENVKIWVPLESGPKIEFPGRGLPGVESDPTPYGSILDPFLALQRPYGAKIKISRVLGQGVGGMGAAL